MPPRKGMELSWSLQSYLLTHGILTPDPSPAWPWGPASSLFMRGAGPGITVVPTGWGRDHRWWRCHFNQSAAGGEGKEGTQGWRSLGPCTVAPSGAPLFLLPSIGAPLPSAAHSPDQRPCPWSCPNSHGLCGYPWGLQSVGGPLGGRGNSDNLSLSLF